MKNKILILLSFLFFSLGIFGQNRYAINAPVENTMLNEATQMADEIVKASGLHANFAIAEANVQNALAVVIGGKRYILYNPLFIEALTRATGTKWAAVSVLAHEIGHHLWRKSNSREPLATELEADEFSGYILAKMGATLDEAEAAMKLLATSRATSTHPAGVDRINSIAMGWKNGGGISSNDIITRNEMTRNENSMETIAATIHFTANPGIDYYVTKKMEVYKEGNEGDRMIARITRSNNDSYPYIIYDDNGFRLYVDPYGKILSEDGRIVGRMRASS